MTHKKDCLLTVLFYRIAARRGLKKAALTVAHRILLIATYVICDGTNIAKPMAITSINCTPSAPPNA